VVWAVALEANKNAAAAAASLRAPVDLDTDMLSTGVRLTSTTVLLVGERKQGMPTTAAN
jgi:hypothetical protein